jgi:parvulin-like peptidyl-prolyl isomerase
MNTYKGETVDMFRRSMQIRSITHIVTLIVFILITSHGSFADAESVRGHGNADDVIVKVDGDPVTRGDILRRIRSAKGDIDPSRMEPDTWRGIVQTATKSEIIDKLFLKAARSENMEIDPENVETFINQSRKRLGQKRFEEVMGIQNATEQELKEVVKEKMLIEEYKSKLIKNITVENEELKKYYEENKDTLSRPDRVHLELLVMDKTVDADAVFQRIKEGEDFEKVTHQDGKNETSSIKRRLMWTTESKFPAEIQPKLKEGKMGDILEPLMINDKYYIMKILEKRRAGNAGLDEVEEQIREKLKREKETMTILSWYESRVGDHKIEYMKE